MKNSSSILSLRPLTATSWTSVKSRVRPCSAVDVHLEKENHFMESIRCLENEQFVIDEIQEF